MTEKRPSLRQQTQDMCQYADSIPGVADRTAALLEALVYAVMDLTDAVRLPTCSCVGVDEAPGCAHAPKGSSHD